MMMTVHDMEIGDRIHVSYDKDKGTFTLVFGEFEIPDLTKDNIQRLYDEMTAALKESE